MAGGKHFKSSVYIEVPPEKVWEAITSPEWTRQWYFDTLVESTWQVDTPVVYRRGDATLFDQFEALGGRRVETVSGFGLTWTVMTDPEGNEFCIA